MNGLAAEIKSLFGQVGRTSVWGIDHPVRASGKEVMQLNLPASQLIVVYQLNGKIRLDVSSGIGKSFKAPGLILSKTHIRGGLLVGDENFSGIVIGFSEEAIRSVLESHRPSLDPEVREVVYSDAHGDPFKKAIPSFFAERWIPDMRCAPIAGPATEFWYEAKIREFISLVCFHDKQPKEQFFCSKQKLLAMDRISLVKDYLAAHIDESLDLETLAQHVGCSRHYLSRTFSEFTGVTITLHLRRLRIERAADLLLSGRYNVSEVAVEVGYQSLSHFSKAFLQEKGCLPSKYDRRVASSMRNLPAESSGLTGIME